MSVPTPPTSPILKYQGTEAPSFKRTIGTFGGTVLNMTQMCGIGPFVTIPLIVKAMGGNPAIFAFLIGAFISIMDGLVWSELGAAMPGAGGTYIYLREAFQYRTGKLMPFLFVWTAMISIPLIMSTGVIGLVQYLGYYSPSFKKEIVPGASPSFWDWIAVTPLGAIVSIAIVAMAVVVLYRKTGAIEKLTMFFFFVMLTAVGAVVVACYTHFHPEMAFSFPAHAFDWPWNAASTDAAATTTSSVATLIATTTPAPIKGIFFLGLGYGLTNAIYDYAGYNTTAYMGAELKDPGHVMPRSILFSILGMMGIYLILQIGVLGAIPWQDIAKSDSIGSLVLERLWNKPVAQVFTGLIIITAFASLMMGLLGGSRVPYNAAKDKVFLPMFGKLHPRLNFPHIALLVMAVVMAIGSLFSLGNVITTLICVMVPVQALAQIAAVVTLRRRQPKLFRPYKMILYPIPAIIALVGWIFVYYSSGWTFNDDYPFTLKNFLLAPGTLSVAWLIFGIIAFMWWAKAEKSWPFGPKIIREEFLEGTVEELASR